MSSTVLRSAPPSFSSAPSSGSKGSIPITYPAELPIVEKREAIIEALQREQVLVVVGETGSGKSTQIPKMCLEAGRGAQGLIGCTQPRRIAAVTLAARVAEELGEKGGGLVGYKIRFQDRTSRNTRIKFMTDGILLAEVQRDRAFRAYDTIIVDEAHERTLNIDFLLGLIKRVLPRRPDLKVIITSATIDPEKFSRAFDGAPIIEVSGRMYPVDVRYRPLDATDGESDDATHVDQAVEAVGTLKSHSGSGGRGDILVFMPTESDIRETVQRLEETRYFNTVVYPLFGRMAAGDQQRVFRATTEEKIIVATNVAETSVTIPRIRYVVDTGLARVSHYNARSRTQGLPVVPISQASADQRKGRCGRVEAGICIRLYSREDYLSRPLYTLPEIQRSNLAEVILRMLYLKLGNVQEFPFMDPPSPAAVKDGFGVLRELKAVDDHRRLTSLGRMMARLPLDPRLSRMLLEARKEGCLHEMVILAAALSVQDPRERPLDQEAAADQAHGAFRDPRSDFVGLLKTWNAC
ncbi:MAG: ATP-dependent RNA helicase HrpA, partial [Syntrophobacteraceae bacterium]|nr:ATP-dependent RNA helicase HrpA [Syntrophobacteraceae bacterium]